MWQLRFDGKTNRPIGSRTSITKCLGMLSKQLVRAISSHNFISELAAPIREIAEDDGLHEDVLRSLHK